MLPILFTIGGLKIYTLGVFLVLAFFWGSFLLWKNIRLTAFKEDKIFDGLFSAILGAIFLGRLIYVLLNWSDFGFSLLKFILINGYPGMSLWGIVFGGVLGLFIFSKVEKLTFLKLADYFTTPVLLALAIGKLGAFFAGSEVGTKTNFVLAFHYFQVDGARHITAIYESILFFIAAYVSYQLLFKVRKQILSQGFNFIFLFWSIAVVYFLLDPLKRDKLSFLGYSFNQTVSLIIFLTLTVYFVYYFRSRFSLRIGNLLLFIFKYGQSINKKVNQTVKRKIARRKEKIP